MAAEPLETRTVLSTYTLPLVNNTGLSPAQFSIYVDGFSTKSGLTLQPSSTAGTLTFAQAGLKVASYQLGTGAGQFRSIQFDASQTNLGARIYFFVVPSGQPAPSFDFGKQPANPPNTPYLYEYVELTQPSGGGLPTIDVSTVDGFNFPVTLTLNNGLGQVGQPTTGLSGLRSVVMALYQTFMSAPGRTIYLPLELPASAGAAGQSGGLLNPYSYLSATTGINSLPTNVASPLNTVFNGALNTLFSRSGWSLMGTDSSIYTAKAGSYPYATRTNPVTGQPVTLPGLQFTGGGNTFSIFNPLYANVFVGANGRAITATSVPGAPRVVVLNNAPAANVLHPGMFVFGTFFNQLNGLATNYITKVSRVNGKTVVFLANALTPVVNDQVAFSQLPDLSILKTTAGRMVFGGAGFFADAAQQGWSGVQKTTLANLENQIDSALNRGVAVAPGTKTMPPPLTPSSNGYTSFYWGVESNWYPPGQPQNLFSLFLHTATFNQQPVFLRPAHPAATKGGAVMGSAYGFSFDENPGPVPPVPNGQPEVPSKFDPVPAGTTAITITLDPWFLSARKPWFQRIRARARLGV